MMFPASFVRCFGFVLAGIVLAACARQDLDEPPVDLGPFKLGLNIVVADNMQKVPISRDATVDEWEAGVKKAVADRFGRYDGERFYNIGVNVDAYALAPPGIPVVAAPKSVIVASVNIWDDATATRLNPEPKQFTVFENLSGDSVVGSGLTQTKEEQLAALSYNLAKSIEVWLLQNPQWFAAEGAIPGENPDANKNAPPPPTVMSAPASAAPSAAPASPAVPPGDAVLEPTVVETTALPATGASPGASPGAPVRPVARPAGIAPAN